MLVKHFCTQSTGTDAKPTLPLGVDRQSYRMVQNLLDCSVVFSVPQSYNTHHQEYFNRSATGPRGISCCWWIRTLKTPDLSHDQHSIALLAHLNSHTSHNISMSELFSCAFRMNAFVFACSCWWGFVFCAHFNYFMAFSACLAFLVLLWVFSTFAFDHFVIYTRCFWGKSFIAYVSLKTLSRSAFLFFFFFFTVVFTNSSQYVFFFTYWFDYRDVLHFNWILTVSFQPNLTLSQLLRFFMCFVFVLALLSVHRNKL